ncbi:MAG: AAA family ATPase [Dehalococcoidia bacterium]
MKKVVAIVGMTGSGKSEVAGVFEEHGFKRVRFGDTTDQELSTRGLERNEENERYVRQQLRTEHGMAAYAKLNLPRISDALESAYVVIDGLYSWEEYLLLKEHYGDRFSTTAVWAAPSTRYRRLATRRIRPLTHDEAASRDRSEIEVINKGGPIAMADFTVLNEGSLGDLRRQVEQMISTLR